MKSNINLNWLRTFEAAARLSGFSAAARELGLTQVAISQHIKSLETKLGHDLFIRHPKKVELTAAGKAYLPSIREGLERLTQATYGLFGSDNKQTIVVRGSSAVLTWLMPRLSEFHQQYPNIKLKLTTSIWLDPVDNQRVDIDILLKSNNQFSDQSEKLSDEYIVPICGVETSKGINSIEDLLHLERIQIVGFDDHWSRYLRHFGCEPDEGIHSSTWLHVDTSNLACELIASDQGGAIMIERFAKRWIEMGRPICIVGDPVPLQQAHTLMKTETSIEEPVSAELEAFKKWLRAEFTEY